MDRFQAIRVFREVARCGGFAAAARSLNTSPPSVSRLIGDLEQDLGVRLFNRSTRTVALTEEGEVFLQRAVSLFDELEEVTEEMRDRQSDPRGLLRISSVVAFGQERIAPAIPAFMNRYPRVQVDLQISNRKVDLIQENFDLAIRIGGPEGLEDSTLKARRIYAQSLVFVATPEYIQNNGAPAGLEDLSNHRLVKQISGNWGVKNEFRYGEERVSCNLPSAFVVNSPNAARNAVLSGGVMGLLADYLVADMLADGRLRRILPDYATFEQPIYAVFVHRSYMSAKVRVFIDHMIETLDPAPLQSGEA